MKKRVLSILTALCVAMSLLPATALAAGSTKTINCLTFTLEVSQVYAMDSFSKSASDGYFTNYFLVVPASAAIKCTKANPQDKNTFLRWPMNEVSFPYGVKEPQVKYACEYDDALRFDFKQGDSFSPEVNTVYSYTGGANYKYVNVSIFVVDDETLAQFGGPKPTKKPVRSNGPQAKPSDTVFVVKGKNQFNQPDAPQTVTQAYAINGNNYLQIYAIAVLLNRTASQFDVRWDGQYAVIEPGKPFSGLIKGTKMRNTKDVQPSGTKFKMNGEVFSFAGAKLINGSTNYIQLKEFAQKLSGTASQFNLYWDSGLGQAIIQPGMPYVGIKYEAPVSVLEPVKLEDGQKLPDGDYYLQMQGKYVYPVAGGDYWMELKDERPDMPFQIKLEGNDSGKEPKYSIAYKGAYVVLPASQKAAQLKTIMTTRPHYWRINMYPSFGTIRDYSNQELVASVSQASGANGAKIIGWPYTGSVPAHAKVVFLKEAGSGNAKTAVRILAYPTKTTYKVGEGFDSAGLKAVMSEGGDKDANDKITFVTAGTVELTQGRPFTTAGKKVVDIRYDGQKFAEYTIVVTAN